MSDKSKSKDSSIVTISTVVGIVFIILKLCGVIDWSWWAVTAPIWVPLGLALVIVLICIILAGGITFVGNLAGAIRNLGKEYKR